MGLIIENSRLFSEAQSRATRERRAREITARMRQSLDIETVLQTAVREMGEALELRDVTIQLLADEATPQAGPNRRSASAASARPSVPRSCSMASTSTL